MRPPHSLRASRRGQRFYSLAALAGVLLGPLAACDAPSRPTAPRAASPRETAADAAELVLQLPSLDVRLAVIELAARDREPQAVKLEMVGGASTEPLIVPLGTAHDIVVHGYDAEGRELYVGKGALLVEHSPAPSIDIAMQPLGDGKALSATLAGLRVVFDPGYGEVAVGESILLSARILDARGRPIDVSPDQVRWSLDGGAAEFSKFEYDLDPPPGVIHTVITPLDIKYTYPRLCYTDDFNRWCDRIELTPRTQTTQTVVYDSVTSGLQFSCGLTRTQDVYCWGLNDMNQLGGAVTQHCSIYGHCSFKPQLVTGGHKFVQVNATSYHVCALDVNNDAYCWGKNINGELGVPPTSAYSIGTPQRVSGGHKFVSVGAGYFHSCGLTAAGEVWCWGENTWGELGNNSQTTTSVPQRTYGNFTYTSLSVGAMHSCAIDVTQSVLCWGNNGRGQLGLGSTNLNFCPSSWYADFCNTVPTSRSYGQTSFASVSAGYDQTCAITVANAEQCWGSNQYGQLGDGTKIRRNTATAVVGSLTFSATSTSLDHTCSRRTGTFGIVFCWGENFSGELGDGAPVGLNGQVNAGSTTPIQVVGGHDFVQVAVGPLEHSCAVTRGGSVYCWGRNLEGALGTTAVATVTAVPRLVQEP